MELNYTELVKEIFSRRETPPLCCVHSYGCQQNVSDGEKITGMLCRMGCGVTYDMEQADVIILNTCAVRENAELKVYGNVGELKHLKEKKPDMIIGLCGCMAQEPATAEKIKRSYRHVDMVFGFSAAGYDLQAMALDDFAYGTSRLVSDANMGSGPSLASNLINTDATAVFYRSTSWNRNRVTNGMYTIVERAGYKIGFFALNDTAQAAKISASNGEFITARDWTDTANEQITALQNAGCDAIIAVASTTPEGDWQKALLNSGVTAIIDGTTAESSANVLGAGLGLDGVAQLNLVFTQGGGCRAEVQSAVTADTLQAKRTDWETLAASAAADDQTTASDAADPDKDTEAAGGKDTAAPTESVDEAQQAGADAYIYAAAKLAGLDADDQSIYYTPLFTYAENPDTSKTISFGNYLAALYAEIVANDNAGGLPEGTSAEAFAGGVTELEYGDITRGDLLNALPATARIQLVSLPADAAKALADGGTVSRVYQNSLTEYAPEGDTAYIVTDTATLAALNVDYTVLRDYGDVFWAVRMNINDLTNNFNDDFVLPEAPQYGVGRRG